MRKIVNVSLPANLLDIVNSAVETGNFSTKSEFFRHLIRNYSEKNLLKELKQSRKDFQQGKGILLKSLKDLR